MTINEVIDQAAEGTRIEVSEIPGEDTVLIRGDKRTFEFLGKLFLAFSESEHGAGVQMSPFGAGKAWFTKTSTKGFHLHFLEAKPKTKRKR